MLFILIILHGCKNTFSPPNSGPIPLPNTNTGSAKALLREIKWITDNARAELFYNPDSTLKTMTYAGSASSYAVDYSYKQKLVVACAIGNVLKQQEFIYDINKQLTAIKIRESAGGTDHQDLEFTYGTNNQVSTMKHFKTSGSGKVLSSTSTYSYDSNNLLREIITADANGNKTIIAIQAYSDPFDYDPLCFTGISLGNYFHIYNLPVLSTMKGLPCKYTKTILSTGLVEERVNADLVISNKKITRQATSVSFPQYTHFDYTSITEFKY